MHFENVSALIEALGPEAAKMGFHWRDSKGPICNQNAVFRVNCMDCLDRTSNIRVKLSGINIVTFKYVSFCRCGSNGNGTSCLRVATSESWSHAAIFASKLYTQR